VASRALNLCRLYSPARFTEANTATQGLLGSPKPRSRRERGSPGNGLPGQRLREIWFRRGGPTGLLYLVTEPLRLLIAGNALTAAVAVDFVQAVSRWSALQREKAGDMTSGRARAPRLPGERTLPPPTRPRPAPPLARNPPPRPGRARSRNSIASSPSPNWQALRLTSCFTIRNTGLTVAALRKPPVNRRHIPSVTPCRRAEIRQRPCAKAP